MTDAFPPGHVFHRRYEVVRCLRSGGMGAVYEVVHLETRRRRALKVMLPSVVQNRDMHARFQLEARIAADIESEHIVETFDAGVDEETGAPFLVMELLRGEDLGSLLARSGALPPTAIVAVLSQVASALVRTHAAGVVHRDLKPDNLFVARRDDGTPKIKILDFGIAKVVAESGQAAARTKVMGTPLYMSPEQIRGDGTVGTRADLYALAHIAFTLLVGRAYWAEQAKQDDVYALMLKIAGGGGPAATTMAARCGVALPAGFDAWFARATAPDPRARFAGAPELVEALAVVLGVPVASASAPFAWPAERPAPGPPSDESHPWLATSVLTDTAPTTSASMTSLGPTMVTGPGPSQSIPDPIQASAPLADATGPAPAPPRKAARGGLLFAVLFVAVAAGLAVRLLVGRPQSTSVVSSATAPVTPSPVAETAPPRLPTGAPVTEPAVAPSVDAGSPRAEEKTHPDADAASPVAPRPRPARPVGAAGARTPEPSVTAPPRVSDDSLLLPRK